MIELVILFVVVPSTMILPIPSAYVLGAILCAVVYAFRRLIKDPEITWKHLYQIKVTDFKSYIFLRVLIFMVVSTILVAWFLPEQLFKVVWKNPLLWLVITVIYSVLSVYPQEILYRVFFYQRYRCLVSSPWLFLGLNALVFCYAHVVFLNTLVFALTFIGGGLFAYSYQKKGSVLLTSIEHSLYGWWLFTLGLGDMLAFPSG